MINWKFYPTNVKIPDSLNSIVNVFKKHEVLISSEKHTLSSNQVLTEITADLQELGYLVEIGKKREDKIKVPVTYKEQGEIDLYFDADAYHSDLQIVVEVEAGRAVDNYQFLKDLFQACMMNNVKYLCIAVRRIYLKQKDFQKVISFIDALYVSNRIILPLKGILVVGY